MQINTWKFLFLVATLIWYNFAFTTSRTFVFVLVDSKEARVTGAFRLLLIYRCLRTGALCRCVIVVEHYIRRFHHYNLPRKVGIVCLAVAAFVYCSYAVLTFVLFVLQTSIFSYIYKYVLPSKLSSFKFPIKSFLE